MRTAQIILERVCTSLRGLPGEPSETIRNAIENIEMVLALLSEDEPVRVRPYHKKRKSLRTKDRDPMLVAAHVTNALKGAPELGRSVDEICTIIHDNGWPLPPDRDEAQRQCERRLTKNTSTYRRLANGKWRLIKEMRNHSPSPLKVA